MIDFIETVTIDDNEITLRHITEHDAPLLVDLFHHLSEQTKRLRFHDSRRNVTDEMVWREASRLCQENPDKHYIILATINGEAGEEAIAVSQVVRQQITDTEAEGALVIRDDFQGRGLGKHLLWMMAEITRQMGITHVIGWVVLENVHLMKLIKQLDLEVETVTKYGERLMRIKV